MTQKMVDGVLIDLTPEEESARQYEIDNPIPKTKEELNAPIYAQLALIDSKSIRPARTGDTARLLSLEAEAVVLRKQLIL